MRGGFYSCRDYSINNFNYPLYLIEDKIKHFNMSKSKIPHWLFQSLCLIQGLSNLSSNTTNSLLQNPTRRIIQMICAEKPIINVFLYIMDFTLINSWCNWSKKRLSLSCKDFDRNYFVGNGGKIPMYLLHHFVLNLGENREIQRVFTDARQKDFGPHMMKKTQSHTQLQRSWFRSVNKST